MQYLHTMIRVGNLDKSIEFYQKVMGFEVVRRSDYPDGKFTLVFMKSPEDGDQPEGGPMLELTYNWGVEEYESGSGYGHVAYKVDSIEEVGKRLEAYGGAFSWGPGKTPNGKKEMAFVDDPDGYKIELIQFN